MLKGAYKNVVYVREMESDLFEQAIFVLKPHAMERYAASREGVIQEAQRVLDGYAARQGESIPAVRRNRRVRGGLLTLRRRMWLWGAGAAVAVAAVGGALALWL
ncbi:MAG: hypothetical protein ACOX7F_08450 [Eubacteriales bacterium]|jgi:hypothetical protein